MTDSPYLRGVAQAADYVGVAPIEIERWIKEGLPYMRVGIGQKAAYLFRKDHIDTFVDEHLVREGQASKNVTRIGARPR